ncbi:MAG: AMP-binding protein [Desulfatiglans sp.]|jgi:long-chain acyl-CoA synthetase|nr:AMP-binding protein [Desulfatiglans sp.]
MNVEDTKAGEIAQEGLDTLPKLLRDRARRFPEKIAMRKRLFGIWNEFTWKEVYGHVKNIALGLLSLGFERGDKAIIIGDNDPEWFWCEWAVLSLGGVVSGVYIDCVPEEVKYYLEHSGSSFVFARDQEQVDKILAICQENKAIEKIVYWDERGLWFYDDPTIMELKRLEELGDEWSNKNTHLIEDHIEKGNGEDIAVFCYTSGTTGEPKAAMIDHLNLLSAIECLTDVNHYLPTDNYISYISPAWITEQFLGLAGGLFTPLIINFPEKPETVQTDIRDIGPQIIFYAARLWENLASTIQVKIIDSSRFKRLSYNLASKISNRCLLLQEEGKTVGPFLKLSHKIADFVVFRPLRDRLGLNGVKVAYTAGAAISPDMMRLFHTIGINIKNLYGSTEAGLISVHRDDDIRYETVGTPFDKCTIKISDEGEIFCKSDMVFKGYYKNPEATKKALKGGYYHTGDAGYFDQGHLIYEDRLSELIALDDNNQFSPQFIEIRFRFSPFIMDAIVFGGPNKPFISAILTIDFENVSKWAENRRIAYTTYSDLSQKKEVRGLLKGIVKDVNSYLPDYSKVKAFVSLHKEFDADEAELTRTRKLKREPIERRYQNILSSIYEKREKIDITSQVTYRDGRVGKVSTELFIDYL